MSRVFVVQRPVVRDKHSQEWLTKYDLRPAEQYGELVDVLPIDPFIPVDEMVSKASESLRDFDPDEDYLLAIGDPIAIAAVSIVAAEYSGRVSILKWDKRRQSYQPFLVDING